MNRQGTFLHPFLHMPRAGEREIRRRDAPVPPVTRAKEEHHAAK